MTEYRKIGPEPKLPFTLKKELKLLQIPLDINVVENLDESYLDDFFEDYFIGKKFYIYSDKKKLRSWFFWARMVLYNSNLIDGKDRLFNIMNSYDIQTGRIKAQELTGELINPHDKRLKRNLHNPKGPRRIPKIKLTNKIKNSVLENFGKVIAVFNLDFDFIKFYEEEKI